MKATFLRVDAFTTTQGQGNPAVLDKMKPNQEAFPLILKELPQSSIHPFAVDSEKEGTFIARRFSSPFSGTTEDSVTGTASGVMGAYALNQIYTKDEVKEIRVFQGCHVQKEGTVLVYVEKGREGIHEVSISGTACLNGEFEVTIGK